MATPYDYELSLLKHVINSSDVDIDAKYLTGDRKSLFKLFRKYYDDFYSLPSPDTLKAILKDSKSDRLFDTYLAVSVAKDYDPKFAIKQLSDEYYERLIKTAVEEYNDSNKGSKKEKFEDFVGFLLTERQDTSEIPQGYIWESAYDRFVEYEGRETNPLKMEGIPTHIDCLDSNIGGAVNSRLNVFVGMAKSGKSVTLANIGYNLAEKSNQHVIYVSGEMPKRELELIIDSRSSMIDSMLIRNGSLSETFKKKFRSVLSYQWEKKANLYVMEPEPNFTVSDILSYIRIYENKFKPKTQPIIIIDYLWLMSTEKKYQGDWDRLSYISQDLYQIICKRLGYCVFSAVHEGLEGMKRKRDGKERGMETVQGSSRIVPNVSSLILLDTFFKEEELTNKMLMKSLANRHGKKFEEYVTYLADFRYVGNDIISAMHTEDLVLADKFKE